MIVTCHKTLISHTHYFIHVIPSRNPNPSPCYKATTANIAAPTIPALMCLFEFAPPVNDGAAEIDFVVDVAAATAVVDAPPIPLTMLPLGCAPTA